jgi:hypothetical protein
MKKGILLQDIVLDIETMSNISVSRKEGECWPAPIVMLHRDNYSPFRCKPPTDLTSLSVSTNSYGELFTSLYVVFDPAIP